MSDIGIHIQILLQKVQLMRKTAVQDEIFNIDVSPVLFKSE